MATDVEALMLRIEASATKLERDMAKANIVFDRGAKRMEDQARKLGETLGARMSERLMSSVSGYAMRISGVVAAAFSADAVINASQAYLRATNSLKVAGLSGEKLKTTFDGLFAIAQANAVPVETLAGLYAKTAQAQTQLGASGRQLMGFTTATAQALRVSGQSAEEASGALLQLGQALTSGTVHAEEYNSMLEGAYPLLQAAAAGIREAGGDVGKLTALVKDGQVSSKAFFYGVLAGAPILTDKLAGSTKTAAQAWTEFQNALVKAVGDLDAATGATTTFTTGMSSMAEWLGRMPELINASSKAWAVFKASVDGAAGSFNAFMGYDNPEALKAAGLTPIGEAREAAAREALRAARTAPKADRSALPETAGQKAVATRIDSAFGLFDKPKAPIKTVSLKDFPADGKKKKGETADEKAYDHAIRKTQEETAAINAEITVVDKSTEEKDKAKKVQELLTAAKRADKELTPQLRAEIEKEASTHAAATVALEKANEARQASIELQKFAGESLAGFFSDIVSGGKNAEDALMNMTKKLADAALQAALLGEGPLATLFGTKVSGGGVGGLIGTLFKGLGFDDGGYTGSGGKNQPAGVVHKGEVVWSQRDIRAAGGVHVVEAMRRNGGRLPGYAEGGLVGAASLRLPSPSMARRETPVAVTYAPTIDARGADAAAVTRLEAALAADRRTRTAEIVAAVNDARSRGRIR